MPLKDFLQRINKKKKKVVEPKPEDKPLENP
jgi:hypothetical protein